MVNAILAKRVNHIVTKGDNPAWPKGSKSRGFSSLLCKHIAERIISETCNAACRMVHLCTAVTHVVSECGNRKSADISKFGNMVYDISFHMRIFSI